MATGHSRSPKCGQLNNTRHSLFPSYTLDTGTSYGIWTSNIKSLHVEILNGFLGFWIFRIGRFLRVVLTFVQNGLSRVNEQKILPFFYAIGLRIFCSTLCVKFEKNRTESNEVAIRIILEKKNTDGANAIGSSSKDSRLKNYDPKFVYWEYVFLLFVQLLRVQI